MWRASQRASDHYPDPTEDFVSAQRRTRSEKEEEEEEVEEGEEEERRNEETNIRRTVGAPHLVRWPSPLPPHLNRTTSPHLTPPHPLPAPTLGALLDETNDEQDIYHGHFLPFPFFHFHSHTPSLSPNPPSAQVTPQHS